MVYPNPTPDLTRRRLLFSALGAATALTLPRTGHARKVPPPEDPNAKKILILGDSMIAGAVGLYLENGLRRDHGYNVRRKGKSSTGLARPDFFSWPKEAAAQAEAFPADAVVAMFGGNDVQGLYMGKGEWITWPEPGWHAEYARRVNAFADIVAPQGQPLFWIGMPVMRPEKFHVRVQRVNTIFRAEMAIRPGGHFIDIWRLLADEDGGYRDRLDIDGIPGGKTERVRAGDGIHLSVAGAYRVEAHVRAIIHQVLSSDQPTQPTFAGAEPLPSAPALPSDGA
ncbi:MAG: DUF459 domain-containing protein [Nannocystis sp.]|nr:DUF459 domain-containing protein [Nannocystis sp.]MBA3549313.1 DUF459 domain-containing protein [Nannocystis sp.]